jgi:glycosyltransferase involved in cell wall biosynthesis
MSAIRDKLHNENPLVSICIPAYNSEEFILQTLSSVLDQTYKNIEVIVVDDGSNDGTVSKINLIKDFRLKFVSQSNKGASVARNTAYKLSSGTYIKFMDADDVLSENCIEQQVNALLNKDNCVASAKWGRFFKNDLSDFQFSPEKVWRIMPGIDWVIDSLVEYGSNMTQPGIFLIPKTFIEKTGLWNEELSLIDDFDFMTRILTECNEVIFCEEAILYYRGGMVQSLSMQKSRKDLESAFKAQMSGVRAILNKQDTAKSRLACANSLQLWAHEFYPKHPDLYDAANEKINGLGGSTVKMDGGKLFILMRKVLGWQTAKKIKGMFNPFRKTDITNPKFLIPKKSFTDS